MDKIKKIIDEWDPIGLFPMAPKDEYIDEITRIYNYIQCNQDIGIHSLAKTINNIFIKTFGDIYKEDIKQCTEVASQILKEMEVS